MSTIANYMQALYMLSRCDSFIASGINNGIDIVISLNAGRFRRVSIGGKAL